MPVLCAPPEDALACRPIRVERIGLATLYQGDSLDVLRQPLGAFAGVVTDPPYSSGGLYRADRNQTTRVKYTEAALKSTQADFSGDNRDQRSLAFWSTLWLGMARELCLPGALLSVFTDWRQLPVTTDAVQAGGWVWRGIGAWDKGVNNVRPMAGRYRAQCEYWVWATNGPRPVAGAVVAGCLQVGHRGEARHHIASKPVAMLDQLMQPIDGPVLDPFMGSGSAGVAAVVRGLPYVGIEIDPHHFDVACRRIEAAQSSAEAA